MEFPNNIKISENLEQMGNTRQQAGEIWRATAYFNAARIIKKLPYEIKTMAQVKNIKGVGPKITAKIKEILETGQLKEVEEISPEEKKKRESTNSFKKIWGVGDVTANSWYQFGFRDLADLPFLLLTAQQKLGLEFLDDLEKPIPRKEMTEIGDIIKDDIKYLVKDKFTAVLVGSYRRGVSSSKDVDILIHPTKPGIEEHSLMGWIIKERFLNIKILSLGPEKFSGLIRIDKNHPWRRLDLWKYNYEEIPTALLGLTGPVEVVQDLRAVAKRKGWKLNDKGLFDEKDQRIPAKSEEEIYNLLGLKYVIPEERKPVKEEKEIEEEKIVKVSPKLKNIPKVTPEVTKKEPTPVTTSAGCVLTKRCPSGYTRQELVDLALECGVTNIKLTKDGLCKAINEILSQKTEGPKPKVLYDVIQEGVMLAEDYIDKKTQNPVIDSVKGWYLSEKFDGVRAIWDGKNFISRSGGIFEAPNWYKNIMPKDEPLDGELFLGRKMFQKTVSVVKKINPIDEEWSEIKYEVFDYPNKNMNWEDRMKKYENIVDDVCENFVPNKYLTVCPLIAVEQIAIKDEKELDSIYEEILSKGGEGVMLRKPGSLYEGKRSDNLLKYKPLFDSEAKIIDHEMGTGRNRDRMGSLVVEDLKSKKVFKIGTGFTDKMRDNYKVVFPKGMVVTYQYADLSDKGIPKQPRFLRKRETE